MEVLSGTTSRAQTHIRGGRIPRGEMAEIVEAINDPSRREPRAPMFPRSSPLTPGLQQSVLHPRPGRRVEQPILQPQHCAKNGKSGDGWLGGHIGLEGGELLARHLSDLKAGLVVLKTNVNQAASDAVDAAVSKVHLVVGPSAHEVASHGMSASLQAATAALGAASGGLGLVLLRSGLKDLQKGIHHDDAEHIVEGANTLVVGTRSLLAGVVTAGHLIHLNPVLGELVGLAQSSLAPLGILHGSVDAALGVKDVVQGLRHDDRCQIGKGLLSTGLGSSLVVAAAGGGLPALAAAGGFLAAKIVHTVLNREQPEEGSSGH